MRERYMLLGLSVILTVVPLAALAAVGLKITEDGFAPEAIFRNMSFDILLLATVSKIFALVFAILSIVQAAELGWIPRFWQLAGKAAAKK